VAPVILDNMLAPMGIFMGLTDEVLSHVQEVLAGSVSALCEDGCSGFELVGVADFDLATLSRSYPDATEDSRVIQASLSELFLKRCQRHETHSGW